MMPMPEARAALQALKAESHSLGVGVHLTLTEGVPLRLAEFPARQNLESALARLPASVIRDEWRAQIESFLAAGLPLTHLDSHHHAAYRHENAFGVFLELAQHYRVPVRNPYPLDGLDGRFAAELFAATGVPHPACFLDVFDGVAPDWETVSKALNTLADGVTEFMVHPAIVDEALRRASPNFAEPRAREMSALLDPRLREALDRLEVELVNFSVLS
jgi:chitin disaccharide deacetylase